MAHEQEINQETINKYVACMNNLSICTGKLDVLFSYCEQNYSEDKFLLSSLDSILNDILKANGNDKNYNKIKVDLRNVDIKSEVKFGCQASSIEQNSTPKRIIESQHEYKRQEDVLNASEVQIQAKKISQPLKAVLNDNKIEYTFKNSTNLKSLSYTNIIKVRITFQNGRIYDYLNVPKNKIKTLITCDKNNISPGKYFNSEIRGLYEYREVSHDYEVVG